MPDQAVVSGTRVCIVITTYKRNDALKRIVNQCRDFIGKYRGPNSYELCITDSDANNPIAAELPARYCVNPGKGFDENLFFFWKDNLDRYDYIFTISDDDIFTPWLNPLYLLDSAMESGAEVFMFNHRSYKLQADGTIDLGRVLYHQVDMLFNQELLFRNILRAVPRHIGTMYSTKLLRETLEKTFLFRRTLHLYAAPVIFAAMRGTLKFSDYSLCLYNLHEKVDGAWAVGEDILNGLADFLVLLKQFLPADLYAVAEEGFFYNYLGSDCWLRDLIAPSPLTRSEGEIREALAGTAAGDWSLGIVADGAQQEIVQDIAINAVTIVVPTRDDPARCSQLLETLIEAGTLPGLELRVVFLVNDTNAGISGNLQEAISAERFLPLRPRLLHATKNHLTVEENILHTLGENLDAVDEHFLIIGNTDQVNLGALKGAVEYLRCHELDLLLIGWLNCEVHEGKILRQLNLVPRHVTPKNRLAAGRVLGKDTFAEMFSDYGAEGHLSYIGCQLYTKPFFKRFCVVLDSLREKLYGIPLALLEMTARETCAVGFWPDVTVLRLDHLRFGADRDEQPKDWWIPRSRTSRGLSRHCILSIVANSLQLSPAAFATLVNGQMVCNRRTTRQMEFTNFLFSFVEQIRNVAGSSPEHKEWQYSAGELDDIVRFGERLGATDIGLPAEQREAVSQWFRAFGVIGDYSDANRIRNLMAGAGPLLQLLDTRPGMDRWVAQVN